MENLLPYLEPLNIEPPAYYPIAPKACFCNNITLYTEEGELFPIEKFKVAIIGVPEGRYCPLPGCMKGPDSIRKELYKLAKIPGKMKIVDLGNMKRGDTYNDTLAGLSDILVYLLEKGVFPIILGGSSALTHAIDKAMIRLKRKYVLATIDSRIDYIGDKDAADSLNYLYSIINGPKSSLAHFINIGYQTHLNDQQVINRLNRKHAELVRIGEARQSIHLTEPLIRDSDVIVFDMSAVRQSDAPGTTSPSSNGFYGEEICLLGRYAGISDSLSVFGMFDVNPDVDIRNQTSGLAAQVIWFFLEGFTQKQYETNHLSDDSSGRFTRYHIRLDDLDEDMVFVKSNMTERWWMEFIDEKTGEKRYIACSHEDYIKANANEIPERWLLGVSKN
ncbi:MAG: arginase family protein [Bacteroidales bacterium]|nr:arginase family protein [Bacteroidales bacterium]